MVAGDEDQTAEAEGRAAEAEDHAAEAEVHAAEDQMSWVWAEESRKSQCRDGKSLQNSTLKTLSL